MQVRLVLTNKFSGESTQHDFSIEEKVTIGRHLGSPVTLRGDGLSRHHFSLTLAKGVLSVEDSSSNGTWLNTVLLPPQTPSPLKSGDVIEIPGYELRLIDLPKPAEELPVAAEPSLPPAKTAWTRSSEVIAGLLEPREFLLALVAVATIALVGYILNN